METFKLLYRVTHLYNENGEKINVIRDSKQLISCKKPGRFSMVSVLQENEKKLIIEIAKIHVFPTRSIPTLLGVLSRTGDYFAASPYDEKLVDVPSLSYHAFVRIVDNTVAVLSSTTTCRLIANIDGEAKFNPTLTNTKGWLHTSSFNLLMANNKALENFTGDVNFDEAGDLASLLLRVGHRSILNISSLKAYFAMRDRKDNVPIYAHMYDAVVDFGCCSDAFHELIELANTVNKPEDQVDQLEKIKEAEQMEAEKAKEKEETKEEKEKAEDKKEEMKKESPRTAPLSQFKDRVNQRKSIRKEESESQEKKEDPGAWTRREEEKVVAVDPTPPPPPARASRMRPPPSETPDQHQQPQPQPHPQPPHHQQQQQPFGEDFIAIKDEHIDPGEQSSEWDGSGSDSFTYDSHGYLIPSSKPAVVLLSEDIETQDNFFDSLEDFEIIEDTPVDDSPQFDNDDQKVTWHTTETKMDIYDTYISVPKDETHAVFDSDDEEDYTQSIRACSDTPIAPMHDHYLDVHSLPSGYGIPTISCVIRHFDLNCTIYAGNDLDPEADPSKERKEDEHIRLELNGIGCRLDCFGANGQPALENAKDMDYFGERRGHPHVSLCTRRAALSVAKLRVLDKVEGSHYPKVVSSLGSPDNHSMVTLLLHSYLADRVPECPKGVSECLAVKLVVLPLAFSIHGKTSQFALDFFSLTMPEPTLELEGVPFEDQEGKGEGGKEGEKKEEKEEKEEEEQKGEEKNEGEKEEKEEDTGGAKRDGKDQNATPPSIWLYRFDMNHIELRVDLSPLGLSSASDMIDRIKILQNIPLHSAVIRLPKTRLEKVSVSEAALVMAKKWTQNVLQCQMVCILTSVGPVRPVVNVALGLSNLVLQPLKSYQDNTSITLGLLKGLTSAAQAVVCEGLHVGAEVLFVAQNVLSRASSALGYVNQDGNIGVRRFTNQPRNQQEARQQALHTVMEGFSDAASALNSQDGFLMMVLKGVPIAILRPTEAVLEGLSTTAQGFRNDLDPRRKNDLLKYD